MKNDKPPGRRGVRIHKDQPYTCGTPVQLKRAQVEFGRMVKSISTMNGFSSGLSDLDIPMILATREDVLVWEKKTRAIAKLLNQFALKLKNAVDNAAKRS